MSPLRLNRWIAGLAFNALFLVPTRRRVEECVSIGRVVGGPAWNDHGLPGPNEAHVKAWAWGAGLRHVQPTVAGWIVALSSVHAVAGADRISASPYDDFPASPECLQWIRKAGARRSV